MFSFVESRWRLCGGCRFETLFLPSRKKTTCRSAFLCVRVRRICSGGRLSHASVLRGGERQRGGDAEDLRQHVAQLVEHLVGDCLGTHGGQTDTKAGLEFDMGLGFMQAGQKQRGGERKK